MLIPPQIRCPYTRKALAEIDGSVEHIVPHALGGGADFSLTADRALNNKLSALDKALAQAPLVGLMRASLGVKTYHGEPKITLAGKVQGHDVPIAVTFTESGATTRVTKPIEMDPSGETGRIVVPADQEQEFVDRLVAGHARKGREVVVERATSLGSAVTLDFTFDVLQIKRATAKIAFLAACRVLGDAYLDDPLYDEWQRCMFAEDPNALAHSVIHGTAFDGSGLLGLAAPTVARHEHAVLVANLGMNGPVVMVGLFGGGFHNVSVIASETSHYGLDVGQGELAICDATARTTRFIDYTDFLVARANGEM